MIHTIVLPLIFIGTISLISGYIQKEAVGYTKGLSGKFQNAPKDGAICKWDEYRNPGKSPRLFVINCKIEQGNRTYSCTYKGNPHKCGFYNQNDRNKVTFYKGLANEAAINQENACNRDTLEYYECPGVEFEKQ